MTGLLLPLLALLVLLLFAGIGLVIWIVQKSVRARRELRGGPDMILDRYFDGRPNVTSHGDLLHLDRETLIAGAEARGYRLIHSGQEPGADHPTLYFERVTQ